MSAYTTTAPLARYALDRIDIEGDGSKALHLRSAHDALDMPINGGVFPPSIAPLAWRPQPVVIGAVANIPFLPGNADASAGFLADAPLASVSRVLDRGDPMEPGTWMLDPSGQQLLLESPPVMPMTVDGSTQPDMAPATLTEALANLFGRVDFRAWSVSDAQAIDTASGYAGIGYYSAQLVTPRQVLAAILPSYGAWWWEDADGVLRITRITAPEAAAPVTELHHLNLSGDLIAVPDYAPGLTRRMAYRPNAYVYGPADLVTDLVDVPPPMRLALTQAAQGIVYASGPLPNRYGHADSTAPMVSCLWREQDAQTEIQRTVGLYAQQRTLYRWWLRDAPELRPGNVVRITHPRYGLAAGKHVLVRAIQRNPATGDTTLTLWG